MARDEEKTVEQLNDEADIAADYLEGLLDIADYEGDIEMGVRNGRPTVQIVADDDEDIKNLIGHDGEVVDALQLLTRLAVQQKTGDRSRLILDVDGYLKKRRQRLRDLALDVIDEVRETGEPANLDPMNSFERKVVHDLVREEGLKSRSHGEEPHRYVTIYLKPRPSDSDLDDEEVDEEDVVDIDIDERDDARISRRSRRNSAVDDEGHQNDDVEDEDEATDEERY
ncbi:hypothetical protein OZX57_08570 [Bifidobacterium sp. ESL0682]|uniref:Jag family protein n=1 Tax=Bifidobacterium sp. ESL0682 TaxID=2983212 RepID=UPI0023F9E1D1|nr:R3H domain-containing nucleic acid-binding protein [Bifidobacterium sp. ESL0682]WEV41971.1 hypothetical protein OZX57_08570 [Bifidobacterium sp. ESL0682]